jgi:hypothetical protein
VQIKIAGRGVTKQGVSREIPINICLVSNVSDPITTTIAVNIAAFQCDIPHEMPFASIKCNNTIQQG